MDQKTNVELSLTYLRLKRARNQLSEAVVSAVHNAGYDDNTPEKSNKLGKQLKRARDKFDLFVRTYPKFEPITYEKTLELLLSLYRDKD